jgi:CRISPR-associated endonuclease Cas1
VLRLEDGGFVLKTAREIVSAKIANCVTLLRRHGDGRPREALGEASRALQAVATRAQGATSLEALLGHEGAAASAYFGAFHGMIRFPEFRFERRTKHPPADRMNALLSYLYTLLHRNVASLIFARGLNPFLGVLHKDRFNHMSLASDLMEEFRALADATAIYLVNNRMVEAGSFRQDPEHGWILEDAERRKVIGVFEAAMCREVYHPLLGRPLSYRRCIEAQVALIARAVLGMVPEYRAFRKRG